MAFKSKLGLGPMSPEILDIIYQYSHTRGAPIMIIPSLNQINSTGGYVNRWSTLQFMEEINRLDFEWYCSDIQICRDHFMVNLTAPTKSEFFTDRTNAFELVHLDASDLPQEDQVPTILWYAQQCSESGIAIEVGTDANDGAPKFEKDKIQRLLDQVCGVKAPEFFVHQTGSLVKETKQAGTFDLELVHKVKETIKPYGVKLKEHNADYLTLEEIKLRRGLVDAMNIAPQLGVIQTDIVLEMFNNHSDLNKFIEDCAGSKSWEKWVPEPIRCNYSKKEIARVCGHYNFTRKSYRELFKIPGTHELMNAILRAKIFGLLDMYLEGLE